MYMMDIMAAVIQEGESLSQEILDAILINLVDPIKACTEHHLSCSLPIPCGHCSIPLPPSFATSSPISPSPLPPLTLPSQSESKTIYSFAVDFVKRAGQYLEPYIQLVSPQHPHFNKSPSLHHRPLSLLLPLPSVLQQCPGGRSECGE